MNNLLVLVSKRGEIFISYLGTDPEVFSAPATITRDVNYEETDKEFGMLTSQIKEAQSAGMMCIMNDEHHCVDSGHSHGILLLLNQHRLSRQRPRCRAT